MGNHKNRQALNITFYNPNSKEDTVKFLTKVIAEELSEQFINKLSNFSNKAQNQCI